MTDPPRHRPTIEPTTPSWVAIAAAMGAGVAWVVLTALQRGGQSLPQVEPLSWISVALIAAGIAALAVTTSRARRDRPDALDPRQAVNRLLLGKTSILAGAGLGAAYVVLVVLATPAWPAPMAQSRVVNGAIAAALCAAWALAGWSLERACRLPDDPDETDEESAAPPGADTAPPMG